MHIGIHSYGRYRFFDTPQIHENHLHAGDPTVFLVLKSQKLNSIEELEFDNENQVDAIQDIDSDNPDDSGFFLGEESNFHLGPINHDDVWLILDTGASKSVVSNICLLSDLQPIEKKMQTYSGLVDITHIGSMRFGKYKIFPVFYAPTGKCNLVSLS